MRILESMRFRAWLSLAIASALSVTAWAASRPRYGGVLRIATREALASYEPAADDASALRSQLATLLFDRLVELDTHGNAQPALAIAWEHDPDFRRWQFRLRPAVAAHDGTRLTAAAVAASLARERSWRVRLLGDDIIIESDSPRPNLLAELALPRNAIVLRASNGVLVGTGPFRLATWQPQRAARLTAFEEHWRGRPYLDAIEITMGRSPSDQALDRQLGRADISEMPPDAVSDATTGSPVDLVAIVWNRPADEDRQRQRDALGLAIDRASLQAGLLQRHGEAAASLLPQWISGYAFLFPTARNLERAREARGVGPSLPITLAYDPADSLARALAERVAVNARDTALTVQPTADASGSMAEGRIVRLRLASPDAAVALAQLAARLGQENVNILSAGSAEALYGAERALLQQTPIVPLVFLPDTATAGRRVQHWRPALAGWSLADAWLLKDSQ